MLKICASIAVGMLAAVAGSVQPVAAFELPFRCGEVWSGQTRTNHSPQLAIDFNRSNDFGMPVVASETGTVVTVRNLGNTSYGKYIVVQHGGGWSTLYAHLNTFSVGVGQNVSRGQQIGTLGNTGGSTGAHLHFEERLNGSPRTIYFGNSKAFYWGTSNYTSRNCGGSPPPSGGASGTVRTSGVPLNVRSGPSTGYSIVGSLANGSRVTIQCQVYGQSVSGTYGTSSLWNRIGSGRFIPDAYTYTGSDGRVAPNC